MHSPTLFKQSTVGHTLQQWKSADSIMPSKKSSVRRFSFFGQAIEKPSRDILTTHTMNKDYDPETGNKLVNQYMLVKEIGRGMHGKVKLAQDLDTSEWVAIKIVDKQSRKKQLGYGPLIPSRGDDIEEKIRREIAIMKKCSHPHVVRLGEVIDDPSSNKIYLALEYMEGGEVEWRSGDHPILTVDQSRKIFRDVVSGLDYLHYHGIIHRDIKPANLLYSKDGQSVKISDFGVSYFNQQLAENLGLYDEKTDRELEETAGTPAFFAPELCCTRERAHQRITKSIDVWALGVTLYCLLYGQCPFNANTEYELFEIIPKAPIYFPTVAQVGFHTSDSLRDLLQRLLEKNSEERITLEQVKRHPWVLEDLADPLTWLKSSNPKEHQAVEVTAEDLHKAVTVMDRFKKTIRRLSSSLANITHQFTKDRSKAISEKPKYNLQVSEHD
ncbi:kinase-like domain-containing protein [Sporodiniella umbellata]|nr:kinase-like domain-containing protein [Sporodiniella umbellata]